LQTNYVHHIQAKILQKLLYTESSTYAGMRPAGVESNHFAYHLEQLIKEKLITKDGKQYTLSPSGLAYIDRLSQGKMVERLQPHIVTAIDLTTPDGKTLLFQRRFQPYIYLWGFPLGKIHYDESIADAAARELTEKTGLAGIPLTHRGMVYIEAQKQGTTISKVLYHVFHGDAPHELPTQTPELRGACRWADHTSFDAAELMPGFVRIKQLLMATGPLFFNEVTEQLAMTQIPATQ
jgi:8-oxo-dGTP pyrophosphatase MutT (NUDIX family)